MTQSEVVNKMALEMALRLGDLCHLRMCKFYINMALTIGTEHFTSNMEELVVMNFEGKEMGRYKGVRDAAKQLGIVRGNIYQVLEGKRPSAGGYKFIFAKDKYLIKR